MSNDYPVLDGIAPSWADVTLKIAATGAPVLDTRDFKSINTSRSLEVGEKRMGGRVLEFTTGSLGQEASITFYQAGYDKLLDAFSAIAPKRGDEYLISLVHFNLDLQFSVPGSVKVYQRLVEGCRIAGDTLNPSEGTDANSIEVPIKCKVIADIVNGKRCVLL
jgi:hypothetical protein